MLISHNSIDKASVDLYIILPHVILVICQRIMSCLPCEAPVVEFLGVLFIMTDRPSGSRQTGFAAQVGEQAVPVAGGRQAIKTLHKLSATGTSTPYSDVEVKDEAETTLSGSGPTIFRVVARRKIETRIRLRKDSNGLLSAGPGSL